MRLRADVSGATGYPQMLVRVGWAPVHADPLPATPRRPLSEVAEWVAPVPRRPQGSPRGLITARRHFSRSAVTYRVSGPRSAVASDLDRRVIGRVDAQFRAAAL